MTLFCIIIFGIMGVQVSDITVHLWSNLSLVQMHPDGHATSL